MTVGQVSDGERNLVRMGDQLLVNGRHRLEVEQERKQQEDRVREITQQLQVNRTRVDQQKVKLSYNFERFLKNIFPKGRGEEAEGGGGQAGQGVLRQDGGGGEVREGSQGAGGGGSQA